jgi:cystathionine beta-lyase family protein involved in aluminum resistance
MSGDASVLAAVRPAWSAIDALVADNSARVIEAFADVGMSQAELNGSLGYGYDDRGREKLDAVYAGVFSSESAAVRAQWTSGTHVLATVLRALVQPGRSIWVAFGEIYDTLRPLVGSTHPLGLGRHGIEVLTVDPDAPPPPGPKPALVFAQRSRGYGRRASLGREAIRRLAEFAHTHGAWLVVDNCYGEFTATAEPTAWGADLVAGSLIKNPGGGLAPTGGYVAGRRELVDQVLEMLTAPGIGGEVGATAPYLRLFAHGFFLAPVMVGEALAGAAYLRRRFADAGFEVDPEPGAMGDVVSAVRLGSRARVERFAAAVQGLCPVDNRARPEAWKMPGYDDPVIMAAGGFVAGATLELSCDAPMRAPYWIYVQGGLSRWHGVLAAERALAAVIEPQ